MAIFGKLLALVIFTMAAIVGAMPAKLAGDLTATPTINAVSTVNLYTPTPVIVAGGPDVKITQPPPQAGLTYCNPTGAGTCTCGLLLTYDSSTMDIFVWDSNCKIYLSMSCLLRPRLILCI